MVGEELLEQEEFKKKQEKLFEQQRKFRNLESDKKYFAEETINVIKKQKMGIDKLKKENEALKELIAKVNSEKSSESRQHQSMESMKEFVAEIGAAIEEEREVQRNIEVHIANFQKKIVEKKRNCVGANSGAENESNLQKQIKILENRLDKANQKFNETIAVNRELKAVIDSLRKERVIFDNLYKKLEGELHEKRKRMADVIEKANHAYEDRDKANHQIQTLKQHAKKEAAEFEREIKEMSHLMEKVKLSSYVKRGLHGGQDPAGSHFLDEQPASNEAKTKQTKKSSEQMERIQKFREDFAKIEAATEIENFEELLRIFSENEERNFQMFKFVNLQSNEIEELEYEVARLRQEIGATGERPEDTEKDRYIQEMERRLEGLEGSLAKASEQHRNSRFEAKKYMALIERVFETIECDRELAKEIGGSKTVSETNFLVFLAIVEHKATQIVGTFRELSNAHMVNKDAKANPLQPGLLTFEDFEDNEEYDKLLSTDDFMKKAREFIQKEQTQKTKKKDLRAKKKPF